MSEAEKWKEWDKRKFLATDSYIQAHTASVQSREAYKAALRREIEKMKEERAIPQWTTAIDKILELLDTVEP